MTDTPNGPSATPPTVPASEAAPAVESAAERIARVKAQRAAAAGATPAPTATAASSPAKRAPAGRASRFLAAGGAVGVGMVMVGGMAAAANQPAEPSGPTLAPVQRIMVVPQAPQPPTQIVVVLPDTSAATGSSTVDLGQVPAVAPAPAVPAEPQPAAPERPAPAPEPVAESHGS